MGLFDDTSEHPPSKVRRYIITSVVFIALVAFGIWHLLRYHSEKLLVKDFLNTVVAGQSEEAYRKWKPEPGYSYKDFLEDWGPDGYYGPVKSFKFEDVEHLRGGSGVVVVVLVSPYQPFPAPDDAAEQSKTKEVKIWVEFKDHSLAFAP